MPLILALTLVAGVGLAYANGANDNMKGAATLVGCGVADHRKALIWATASTVAGSLLALLLGAALVQTFSGKGLVPDAVLDDPVFVLAVAWGAAGTVFAATVAGLPVSTTHALVGGLCGAGLAVPGGAVHLDQLGKTFVTPLLVGPVVAGLLVAGAHLVLRRLRAGPGLPRPATGSPRGQAPGEAVATRIHYLSAGAVCLSRGVNDTPKIVALLLGTKLLPSAAGIVLVGGCMAVGGILQARRVTRTMSRRITEMNQGQALSANLVTAVLVLAASRQGMPVSTTHVSCGSIMGLGAVTGRARWNTVATIVLAWAVTLPLACALAAGVALVAG